VKGGIDPYRRTGLRAQDFALSRPVAINGEVSQRRNANHRPASLLRKRD
jgi:hypothetical protein